MSVIFIYVIQYKEEAAKWKDSRFDVYDTHLIIYYDAVHASIDNGEK